MAATLGNGNITFGDSTTQSTAALPLTGGTVSGATTFGAALTLNGAVTCSNTFAANAGATLGDASGDALTINSNTATIPNTLKLAYNNTSEVSANTSTDVLILQRTSNAAPAAGIGTGIQFVTETAAGNKPGSAIRSIATDVSSGAEKFDLTFNTMLNGADPTEKMKIRSNGVVNIGTSGIESQNALLNVDGGIAVKNTYYDPAGGTNVWTTFRGDNFNNLGHFNFRGGNRYLDVKVNVMDNAMMYWYVTGYLYNSGNINSYGGAYSYMGGIINVTIQNVGNSAISRFYRAADGFVVIKLDRFSDSYSEGVCTIQYRNHNETSTNSTFVLSYAQNNTAGNYF